jgi:hypothetical protein
LDLDLDRSSDQANQGIKANGFLTRIGHKGNNTERGGRVATNDSDSDLDSNLDRSSDLAN